MIIIRPKQQKHIEDIALAISKTRKVLAQLPTGGGKTVEFCAISRRYIDKNQKRVLILVHRKELLAQTKRTAYNNFGLSCQAITAGMNFIPPADIYVGMIESAYKRLDKLFNIGLVIIDECHFAAFNKVHEKLPEQLIIGFSATPLSSSPKRPLKNYYDGIVCGPSIGDLIEEGHLAQNITIAPKDVVDRMELEVKGNDFDEHFMAQQFSKPKFINSTLKAYEKYAKGTKAIVFNVNKFHSLEVNKRFLEAGYDSKHLDSDTPDEERTAILQWFANTPGAILHNIGIATTGFDEPTIETVICNKATQSMPLWLQMGGRGGRVIDEYILPRLQPAYSYALSLKLHFNIIDMGGNAVAHGDWCAERNWQDIFENPPKPGKPTAGPVKGCPQCDAIIPASAKKCGFCGYIYPAKDVSVEEELSEFIVLTKGIDVEKMIKDNEHRKIYYSLFQIGRNLAADAKLTVPKMSNEAAEFILECYFELAKVWTKANKKRFNEWFRNTCRQHLFEELKKAFPKWEWQPEQKLELENLKPLTDAPINQLL